MRIAIGGISHETNTFCRGETTIADFKGREWSVGPEIIERHSGVRDYVGGMLAEAERLGYEIVPTFLAEAQPSATIAHDTFQTLRDLLLAGIREAGEIDAVCLALHGAGVAVGIDDIEGALLSEVRALVGPSVPIAATLDLHGNLTQQMVDAADFLVGVHLYPHTDMYERGQEAVELVGRLVKHDVKPVMHLTKLPMMIAPATTNLSPAKDINELCWSWEERASVLDCVFFHGFATADIPPVGVSVLATTDGDPALAAQASQDLAKRIWARRDAFLVTPIPPAEAFRQALATEGRPVILYENSDNPGGGAPGDGTHLLRAMIDARLTDACLGFIYDPATAEQAHRAGVGSTIQARLGGKIEPLHGEPIVTEAYVKCLTDGRFIQQSPMRQGHQVDLGKMARLVIAGIDVLVSSVRRQTLDAEVFVLHGIDVSRYKIVAIKSSAHFRAAFEPIAHRIIRADTPGLMAMDLSTFPYQRVERPIWPLDQNVAWP